MAAFDRIATLDKVPLLSSLGKSQKAQLAKELLVKVYPKGAQVMVQGQEGDFFLIIVDGKLDVTASSGGHLAYLSDGDYAGEQALLKATTRNASLTAVEETTCLLCSKHTFDKIKKSVKFANRCSVYILSLSLSDAVGLRICGVSLRIQRVHSVPNLFPLCLHSVYLFLSILYLQRGQKAEGFCHEDHSGGEDARSGGQAAGHDRVDLRVRIG